MVALDQLIVGGIMKGKCGTLEGKWSMAVWGRGTDVFFRVCAFFVWTVFSMEKFNNGGVTPWCRVGLVVIVFSSFRCHRTLSKLLADMASGLVIG